MTRPLLSSLFLAGAFAAAAAPVAAPPPGSPPPPALAAADPTNRPAAKIRFASTKHDFGRVASGEIIKHEFVFTNVGNATLEITGVHPACRCTVPSHWTRLVEPGQTGVIPIEFNTGWYVGPQAKYATVTCNDRTQPSVMLQLAGTLWRPIEVTPQRAALSVVPDAISNSAAVVRIASNLEQPLELSNLKCTTNLFAGELKTVVPGKQFDLVITATKSLPTGTSSGTFTLATSCTNSPVLTVPVVAFALPAVIVSPSQIVLQSSGTNPYPALVSIRNQSANPLTVSEPAVNSPDVGVQLREVMPGRQFSIMLTFPPGFDPGQGSPVEFTIKTSHPQFPLVRVPVARHASRAGVRVMHRPAAAPGGTNTVASVPIPLPPQ